MLKAASAKLWFRQVNGCVVKHLEEHVRTSLAKVTVQLARQHGRKAREYRAAYQHQEQPENKAMVEKLVKESKAHSNTMDQDMAFVLQQMEMVEGGCG